MQILTHNYCEVMTILSGATLHNYSVVRNHEYHYAIQCLCILPASPCHARLVQEVMIHTWKLSLVQECSVTGF